MATTTWTLDPMHSEVQFKVKHLVISTVTGAFKTFSGTLETEGEDFATGKTEISLDVASIDTNQAQRDEHLKAGDFFDAATYPHLKFVSTGISKASDGSFKLAGNLTIKDVTKPVTLDVEYGGTAVDFYGNTKAGFDATTKISRKEFGLTWDGITEAGSIVVGDEVKIIISAQFAKVAAEVAA